jgi:ABC-type cobalamin/Fe3+-siderophores transport system ATPase subunit
MSARRARPGRFVVVVGPDGVGKTTLAAELLKAWPAERRYFHFRPVLRWPMLEAPPPPSGFLAEKPDRRGSRALGWLRIMRNLVLFSLGYFARVRPALHRGALVVGDRWAYGYLAAPHALKYYGPRWLARLVLALLPEPDLVACLTAPAEVVISRKPELTVEQVTAEDRLWQAVPARRKATLTALDPPDVLARKVLGEL